MQQSPKITSKRENYKYFLPQQLSNLSIRFTNRDSEQSGKYWSIQELRK